MYQVLLVDDEPILQLGIRRMLEGAADYQICASARNGEEALQYLQAHPVDIVMTDLKMPVMDGITLIKELKRRQLPAPVIVLSNYSDFELVREALTEGASDYVLKLDLTAQTLLKHLDKLAASLNAVRRTRGEQLPPQELFSRIGTERYTKATYTYQPVDENGNPKVDANGNPVTETKEIYIYNEEDPNDTTKQYTLQSLSVNEALVIDETLLPHLCQNGDVDYALAAKLAGVWDEERLTLNPNDTKACSFKDYYKDMIGEMATYGNVYNSTATSLTGTVASVDNQRQQVIGVSSDEELTYMIKYQNAYNAASRFINVVNEMIEHLLTQLG